MTSDASSTGAGLSAPRVLLVDDDQRVTEGLTLALRREHFEIGSAGSGSEALALLAREPFDAIVSDERMPGMAGSELLTLVRERFPDIVRIILSGEANVEAAVRAINAAEIHRFLIKPCPAPEIAATIREALRLRAARREFEAWRTGSLTGDRAKLDDALSSAIEAMWIGFQPVVASHAETFGYEALVRSDNPQLGTPATLLAAAAELHRSIELGRCIRSAVARRVDAAPATATILVNVNPHELADPVLLDGAEPLAQHAERVVLEITERESLEETENLQGKLSRLRALGYRIAVDDLGAGYAGLTSLVLLSPAIVKLDMELVRNIDCSPTQQKLVGALVRLARELAIKSLAEGVETDAEYATVRDLGCDLFQGFLFGKAERTFKGAMVERPIPPSL